MRGRRSEGERRGPEREREGRRSEGEVLLISVHGSRGVEKAQRKSVHDVEVVEVVFVFESRV